jgi:hypothetical protein
MNSPIGDDPSGEIRIGAIRPTFAGEAAAAAEVAASDAPSRAGGIAEVQATTEAGAAAESAAITDALVAGAIDAEAAKSRLIDAIVTSALPPGASAGLIAELRADVAAMLLHHPQLDHLLRRA